MRKTLIGKISTFEPKYKRLTFVCNESNIINSYTVGTRGFTNGAIGYYAKLNRVEIIVNIFLDKNNNKQYNLKEIKEI